jgi:hypothetical protein
MDDLVAIILTLVFVGIGAFGQMKKKKNLIPEPESNNNKQDDIWGLFEKVTGFENYRQDPYGNTEVVAKEPGPAVNEQNYSFKATDEGGSVIEKESQIKKSIVRKNVIRENFSLKQAVIYNEILNRKYF